jgi:hypothetical protein
MVYQGEKQDCNRCVQAVFVLFHVHHIPDILIILFILWNSATGSVLRYYLPMEIDGSFFKKGVVFYHFTYGTKVWIFFYSDNMTGQIPGYNPVTVMAMESFWQHFEFASNRFVCI